MRATTFVVMLLLVLLPTAAMADVPGLINYQGTLIHAYGVPLDTTVDMTFSIYTDSTGGSQVWTETQSAVGVNSGIFNVLLGRVNAISDTVFKDPSRWLGVQVGGDPELQPRQRIAAVGYALQSAAGGTDGDWTIDGDNLYRLDGNVGIGKDDPAVKLDIVGMTRVQGGLFIAEPGSTESVLNLYNTDVSDWELAAASDADRLDIGEFGGNPSVSIAAGGDVGIGTSSPAAKLDVQGTLNVGEDDTGYDVNFYGAGSGSKLFWDEDKMALRAGRDYDGTHWAPDSIGNYSFATGYETKAKGTYSVAMGLRTTASGTYSTAMGQSSIAGGTNSIAMGWGATTSGTNTIAMGHYVKAGPANYTMVLGRGISSGATLVNNIENSLIVGFNDTTATLFVGGTDHRVGIGTTSPGYKLDVAGQAHATGFPTSSDSRLKANVQQLGNVLDRLEKIRGVSFDWNEQYESMGRSTGYREIGVIAQEVEAQFPELVTTWGVEQYRAVDYGRLTGVLIEAVKELRAENRELKEEIEAIKAKIK